MSWDSDEFPSLYFGHSNVISCWNILKKTFEIKSTLAARFLGPQIDSNKIIGKKM